MNTTFLILALSLTFWQVILPWARYQKSQREREAKGMLNLVKVWAVGEWYESVQDLSLAEIREQYDVEQSYQRIGFTRK